MRITVLICTYNRAESLRRTLETLARLEVPAGDEWELLLVDNDSSDGTAEVCREFTGKLPVRYLVEKKHGKGWALNLGVRSSRGELLLFTDDDVDVDALWLKSYAEAAKRLPEALFFAGRVVALLEGRPPKWFAENARTILSSVAVNYDLGESEHAVDVAIGANMAIRAAAFEGGILFRPDLGPDGTETVRSEEVQFLRDLAEATGKRTAGIYLPEALVHHRTNANRMTERNVRRWYYGDGIARVRRNQVEDGPALFGVPRYLWRQLAECAARYALLRPFAASEAWLKQEIDMSCTMGIISELRKRRAKNREPEKCT